MDVDIFDFPARDKVLLIVDEKGQDIKFKQCFRELIDKVEGYLRYIDVEFDIGLLYLSDLLAQLQQSFVEIFCTQITVLRQLNHTDLIDHYRFDLLD